MSKLILSEATRFMEVFEEYPYLTETLEELDPILRCFKNPLPLYQYAKFY
ncbi:MAG: hypothetical protein ACW98F_09680 [Candidatus Hodarchaeales archaeon]